MKHFAEEASEATITSDSLDSPARRQNLEGVVFRVVVSVLIGSFCGHMAVAGAGKLAELSTGKPKRLWQGIVRNGHWITLAGEVIGCGKAFWSTLHERESKTPKSPLR